MEIREKQVTDEIVGHSCDICGKPCFKDDGENRDWSDEHATLSAEWGYWSEKDGAFDECQMCEPCYDKVRHFIENELKGSIRTRRRF